MIALKLNTLLLKFCTAVLTSFFTSCTAFCNAALDTPVDVGDVTDGTNGSAVVEEGRRPWHTVLNALTKLPTSFWRSEILFMYELWRFCNWLIMDCTAVFWA